MGSVESAQESCQPKLCVSRVCGASQGRKYKISTVDTDPVDDSGIRLPTLLNRLPTEDRARRSLRSSRDFDVLQRTVAGDDREKSRPQAKILQAARAGDYHKVVAAVEAGCDVRAANVRGQDPLMLASQSEARGSLATVKFLLDLRADPESRDCEGWTALLHACRNSREETTRTLLERRASVHTRTNLGQSAMMLANFERADSLAMAMAEANGELACKDGHGYTVLLYAIEDNRTSLVNRLLRKKASASDFSNDGTSALMLACKNGNIQLSDELLKRRASVDDVDGKGRTALMISIETGQKHVCDRLFEQQADITIRDLNGRDALDYADETGSGKVIQQINTIIRRIAEDEERKLPEKQNSHRERTRKKVRTTKCTMCDGNGKDSLTPGMKCQLCEGKGFEEEELPDSPHVPKGSPSAQTASMVPKEQRRQHMQLDSEVVAKLAVS